MERLKKRSDFLKAAKAAKWATRGLVLQARARCDKDAPRVGFTVTKRVGNAVVRNRVKRRLREAARLTLGDTAREGYDYVVIGRRDTLDRSFGALREDLAAALAKVHTSSQARLSGQAPDRGRQSR